MLSRTLKPDKPILIVDDEEQFLLSASLTLKSAGLNNINLCSDSRGAPGLLQNQEFSLILLDMMMPNLSGPELVEMIVREYPHIPISIITAINDVDTAVECMKAGAFDYLVKPVDPSRLISSVKRALELGEVKNENTLLKQYLLFDNLENPEAFAEIRTKSQSMRAIFQYLEAIARTSLPVLITGETGVGKELIAAVIHKLSGRTGAFVPVNVAGLDDNFFSDTLFGHKRGAFTGAERDRSGLLENAAEGTLFLDEIGDLRMESQIKLLRLLQEGNYYPLGSDMLKYTDARVVVATNCNLDDMQENGEFRKDLYYRLKTHHVHIPPLRERFEDLPLLVEHFLRKAGKNLGKKWPRPPKELFTLLRTYSFPGNIRELEGMIFDAVSQHKGGILSMETFKLRLSDEVPGQQTSFGEKHENAHEDEKDYIGLTPLPSLKDVEQLLINKALERADGNQTIAARMLGMSRKALNNRLIRSRK